MGDRLRAEPEVPSLPGVVSSDDVRRTVDWIASVQERDGAIPWTAGGQVDVWNHLESTMALLVGGRHAAAERALAWCATTQRPDGSWPLQYVAGQVTDHSGDTNMAAYPAVALWHHWLVRRDHDVVRRYWPMVRRALDWVVSLQLPFGGVAWAQEWSDGAPAGSHPDALLAGSSSIHHSLRAGVALAALLGDPQPAWELAGGRLAHAVRAHRDLFLDKSRYAMDWYYPVLAGGVRGDDGRDLLRSRWTDFVEPGLGVRCVVENPWVTGAETCELAMALDVIGECQTALALVAAMQHLRADDGAYWTGYVVPDDVRWPGEQTTYTAAAVVLAVDALSGATPGGDLMRGESLPPPFRELALGCGCAGSADRLAGLAPHPAQHVE